MQSTRFTACLGSIVQGKTPKVFAGFSLLLCLAISTPAHTALLQAGQNTTLNPAEPIQVQIPEAHGSEIFFELDGMDITALAIRHEGGAIIHPSVLLNPGSHLLLVHEIDGSGLRTIAQYRFDVEVPSGFRLADFHTVAGISASRPVRTSGPLYEGVEEAWELSGAAHLDARWQSDGSEITAQANVIVDTLKQTTPFFNDGTSEQRSVDLRDYKVQVKKGEITGRIGHHSLRQNSLVLRDFHRRGISLGWERADERASGAAFSFQSKPVTGISNVFGVNDSDTRIEGASFNLSPRGKDGPTIMTTWLSGSTDDTPGFGVVDSDEASSGDAASIALKLPLADRRVEIQAEGARSDFDFDGDEGGQASIDDDAHRLGVVFKPRLTNSDPNSFSAVELGIESLHVGTFFKSLANPGQPTDLDSLRGWASYLREDWSLQLMLENQSSNSNDSPLLPTIDTDLVNLSLNFYPSPANGNAPRFNYGLAFFASNQNTVSVPDGIDLALDFKTQQLSLFASATYNNWDWNTNLSLGRIQDSTGSFGDSDNQMLALGINTRPRPGTQFGVLAQFSRNDVDQSGDSRDTLFNLNLNHDLIPDRLNFSGNLSWSDSSSDFSADATSKVIDLGLNWRLRAARRERAGLTLWLRTQYVDRENPFIVEEDPTSYQVLLGLSLDYAR